MKTPIQELIEQLKELQETQDPYSLHDAIDLAESMLEKEKKVIVEAFKEGVKYWNGDEYKLIDVEQYYNHTYNTNK